MQTYNVTFVVVVVNFDTFLRRNERRTFESLSELEQQLKSSVKRYHRRNADNFVENNLSENVEQSVETFDNSDGVILEQARRRQRIKEVTIWSSKYQAKSIIS